MKTVSAGTVYLPTFEKLFLSAGKFAIHRLCTLTYLLFKCLTQPIHHGFDDVPFLRHSLYLLYSLRWDFMILTPSSIKFHVVICLFFAETFNHKFTFQSGSKFDDNTLSIFPYSRLPVSVRGRPQVPLHHCLLLLYERAQVTPTKPIPNIPIQIPEITLHYELFLTPSSNLIGTTNVLQTSMKIHCTSTIIIYSVTDTANLLNFNLQ